MSDILSQKCVMLWEVKSGGVYLPALEREKQLLFFLLAYVAADKAARLPALRTLLQSLRLPLLGEAAPPPLTVFRTLVRICLLEVPDPVLELQMICKRQQLTKLNYMLTVVNIIFDKSMIDVSGHFMFFVPFTTEILLFCHQEERIRILNITIIDGSEFHLISKKCTVFVQYFSTFSFFKKLIFETNNIT
jgi:hypothetical protein